MPLSAVSDPCSCQLCGTQLLGVGLPPGLGLVERAAKSEKKLKDHPNGKVFGGGSGRQGEGVASMGMEAIGLAEVAPGSTEHHGWVRASSESIL